MNTEIGSKILLVLTALIHLFVGIQTYPSSQEFLDLMILLNGVGYFGFYLAVFHSESFPVTRGNRTLFTLLLIIYTAVTFVAYFAVWGADGLTSIPGMLTKLIELVLIFTLYGELKWKQTHSG